MKLTEKFLQAKLKEAEEMPSKNAKYRVFRKNKVLYFVSEDKVGGLISNNIKSSISKSFKTNSEMVFISLFTSRKAFQQNVDEFAWGSFVWFADEPEHTIHFENRTEGERETDSIGKA